MFTSSAFLIILKLAIFTLRIFMAVSMPFFVQDNY